MDDEVTTNGELAGFSGNMESFWDTVAKVINVENKLYKLTDANDNKHHLL